ncbi:MULTISPECIES: Tn3 family transposase [unclassified Polaromonas]|jgi:TnpA family transposase|uniref:Tn3 family transposase n=1 Tax=Polaromonas aquatica TaxID=332657 RepID=A0ABW1TUF0_9BURK|nr:MULTISPECIES: Tn3 family transposase [unclassified Polaromonas]OYY33462.1 MAG: Tn3 family transposase [Polaromonas sp. 35-63-35]OYZ17763.1 MAG: Tn3 family transposase [Polaromonas sp. 16-63-31]OYZ76964.1 MAG: Tn3 family transposase [Polaromonas sp. 24-63-21]OZA48009.1 MAG: Tn3 family transposase [Polaromonas sp. 17-63-33]OZA86127.1 MAG: Tn3 family transposase [Polaromonas sp. 39-63-25]
MPRRSVLSVTERDSLLVLPDDKDELIRHYTFNETDLSLIRQRRGDANRLGVAVQLCLLRFPGQGLLTDTIVSASLLGWIGRQLRIDPACWPQYAERETTRREHLLELRTYLGMEPFVLAHYRQAVHAATELALQTDKGIVLAGSVLDTLRHRHIIIPALDVIERVCAEAITRANRRIHAVLTDSLETLHRPRLDELLKRKEGSKMTWLAWLRQSPAKPNSRHMLEHIERLKSWQALDLPAGIERKVHQNRLLKIAREGGQMTPADLAKFEPQRRYATLVALAIEGMATVTDEIIDLHDRIIGKLFNAAKNKHQQQFQASGKAINDKVRLYGCIGQALIDAKQKGGDPFAAIEAVMPWDTFAASVTEAQTLARPADFDFLHHIGESYATLRRYAPQFLDVLKLRAAPAAKGVLDAINVLRGMNSDSARKVPADAPTAFIKPRWAKLVLTDEGIDRRYYELCALSELKNALRSGDVWVQGSRQFKDFDEYLVPVEKFVTLKLASELPLAVATDCDQYLRERLELLEEQLATVNRMAAANDLPDAIITTASGLKITPLDAAVPDAAQALIDQTAMILPHLKITELLMEVDEWTGFTRHFTHLKTGDTAKDKTLLMTTILADAINLGLTKMAESCPGTTYAKLSWLQAWHVRDETYSTALAELVNAQFRQPFAGNWGDGTTSSSDGQNFRTGSKAESTGHINPKYGSSPGRTFYTHISDQYAPFSAKVVNVGLRDSTYVLDGLLYHESDLRIEEHYTDTAGFTDHVFGLMHLLGFRFAPRIRDLGDTKLFIPKGDTAYDALKPMISSDRLNIKAIRAHWDEILRLATSIKQGTVTASLMLRKLGSYPRQNGLAVALRELGRIERTLFILDWLQSVELRRRVQAGLNKGEARNALARAVFFNRLGEIRDRSFEQQRYRASGLNLVTAAIVLWNTVYLERAANALRHHGQGVDDALLQYLSPLGWEHINLTGDYLWRSSAKVGAGKFRPLRPLA